jgi:putative NIF3 family GTP cyclohydrolase 1 type 2
MIDQTFSRRRFCQFAASSLVFAPTIMRAKVSGRITAREVLERMKKNVGVPWHTPTADTFKIGDPDAPLTGITTTFMSTYDLIKRSAAAGNNFIVSHEPTWWSAADVVSDMRDDPLYRNNLDFIRKNNIVVMRFHDHWHAPRPDGIFTGWNKAMGWDKYLKQGANPFDISYEIPETTLENLAADMQKRLNVNSMRIVGDPKLKITRVGHGGHYIAQCMAALPKVDLIIVGESREWEAAEYIRDAVAAGEKKALIQLPHEGGEEEGMRNCAEWMKTFVSEVPVQFIPSGDGFWIPA